MSYNAATPVVDGQNVIFCAPGRGLKAVSIVKQGELFLAKDLWGNYWSWDPVETWSLVTWLTYGLAIHLRLTLGWRGRRLAWIVILALAGMFITFFGINIFVSSSLHFFGAMQGK